MNYFSNGIHYLESETTGSKTIQMLIRR